MRCNERNILLEGTISSRKNEFDTTNLKAQIIFAKTKINLRSNDVLMLIYTGRCPALCIHCRQIAKMSERGEQGREGYLSNRRECVLNEETCLGGEVEHVKHGHMQSTFAVSASSCLQLSLVSLTDQGTKARLTKAKRNTTQSAHNFERTSEVWCRSTGFTKVQREV